MPYTFIALDPRPQVRATEIAKLQDAPTLGIEVTIPELAAMCSLGNIDPQHSEPRSYVAAIDEVQSVELPPDGSQLATVRPDVDSVGAMAWIANRAADTWDYDGLMDERVRAISNYDTFASGEWKPIEREKDAFEMQVVALNRFCTDPTIDIARKVQCVQSWLSWGDFEGFGELLVGTIHQYATAQASMQVRVDGDIAIIESAHPSRMPIDIAYESAPIVILKNPAMAGRNGPHLKYSISVWPSEAHRVDLRSALAEFQALEEGWGGSPTMIGSPQGAASTLTFDEVVEIVKRYV